MAKPSTKFVVVLVTAPEMGSARKLARAILRARLAACVNIVPNIESHYRWKGHVETAGEILLIIKSTRARLKALEKLVLETHPYETPEFLAVSVSKGSADYLKWLADSTR